MQPTVKKNRSAAIDSLKGVLIILVVIGHVSAPNETIALLVALIYCFHMPAFFVLSSLFVKKSIGKEFKSSFIILIVYVAWFLYSQKNDWRSMPESFLFSNWHHLKNILWFLPALFIFKIITSVAFSNKLLATIGALIGITTILFNNDLQLYASYIPWGVGIAFYMLPCVLLAKWIYTIRVFPENFPEKFQFAIWMTNFIIALALFYRVVPVNISSSYHYKLDFAQFTLPSFGGYALLCSMMISLIGVGKLNMPNNILSWIGNRTMPVFLFHYFFIIQLSRLFSSSTIIGWVACVILPVTASLIVSMILNRISNKFRYIGA